MSNKLNSKKAILFVHGILETPKFFEPFLPLIPEDWTVRSVLLDGHIGAVTNFSKASMSRRKAQVHSAVKELTATHDKVVIAAHSMGTLFAISESVDLPVSALFLMNIPLKIGLKPLLLKVVWNHYTNSFDPNDKIMMASKYSHGLDFDSNIFHYIGWIPRFLELFNEIAKTRPLAEELRTPTMVYFSKNDEMLSIKSAVYFKGNPRVKLKLMRTSYHHYFSPDDLLVMQRDFQNLVTGL